MIEEDRIGPLALPAVLLGIGLGAFLEAILLQQILQWHHLLYWAATLIGIVMMFVAARRDDVVWSARVLAGGALFGVGAYNFCEGILAHLVLGAHHIGSFGWDLAFIAIAGLGFMLAGYLLGRSEAKAGRG